MTNLEKYLAELLADSVGCSVHKIRTGGVECDNVCGDCAKENLKWLNSEWKEVSKKCKDCCYSSSIIQNADNKVYCCRNNELRMIDDDACNAFDWRQGAIK